MISGLHFDVSLKPVKFCDQQSLSRCHIPSANTLKPLICEVNWSSSYAMFCWETFPLILMVLWHLKHYCRPSTALPLQCQSTIRSIKNILRCWLGLQTPQIPIQSIHRGSASSLIHKRPPAKPTRPKMSMHTQGNMRETYIIKQVALSVHRHLLKCLNPALL